MKIDTKQSKTGIKPKTQSLKFMILALLIAIGTLTACQSKPPEHPTIPDEKLARIMADINIADAATAGLGGYAKDSLAQAYFKHVFEIHAVSLEDYEKNLRVIANDLTHMELIVKKADSMLTEVSKSKEINPEK